MGWTTLYITGKGDFREEVREKLEDSDLDLMPGHTGTVSGEDEVHDLYWIDDKIELREVKIAIGSKLIWKYRLRFYPTLEEFIEAQNNRSTSENRPEDDSLLLEELRASTR